MNLEVAALLRAELLAQRLQLRDEAAEGGEIGVRRDPAVAEARGARQRRLRVAADDDGYGAARHRLHPHAAEVVVLAVVLEELAAHRAAQDDDALVHQLAALVD